MFEHFLKTYIFGKPNLNFKPRHQNPKSRRTDPRHPEAPEQRQTSRFKISEKPKGLLYFPNIPKVKTAVFLVKYQNPRGQDPSNPLRNTLVCRHFLISFLKSSHQKIIFQISVGIFAQMAPFGNGQNPEHAGGLLYFPKTRKVKTVVRSRKIAQFQGVGPI